MDFEVKIYPRLEKKVTRMATQKNKLEKVWDYANRFGMNGWYTYLEELDLHLVEKNLNHIDTDVDYILSIGTGGSYQGIELILEFSPHKDKFIFLGPSLDPAEINEVIKKIKGKKVGFNIISKSGSTLEIILFINIFKEYISKAHWISIVTSNPYFSDFIQGHFNNVNTIKTFEIAENIGGRFSMASVLGVVTAYLAGLDFKQFINGFLSAKKKLENGDSIIPLQRGVARYLFFSYGSLLENLSTNIKKIAPTLKWARQLWAESNGKENKGMFVSSGFYPEDAHSVGQIWKEGPRKVAETFFILNKTEELIFNNDLAIANIKIKPNDLAYINKSFIEAIIEDRIEAEVPVAIYKLDDFSLCTWGELLFNEMMAVVVEAYYLGVNPFDQPGVESYKKKVKAKIL